MTGAKNLPEAPESGTPGIVRVDRQVRPLCEAERAELAALRRRVKAQRAELRRLNKTDSLLWAGWRWGCDTSRRNQARAKMIRAFGLDAVMAAERAA